MKAENDNPNVLAPPPLIFLSGLCIGGLLKWLLPQQPLLPIGWIATGVGIVLIAIGLAIIVSAIVQMRRAKTNVEPWKPTTKILDQGLYGISRNPIYMAMTLVYIGIAAFFNSFWFLPSLVLVLPTIHYGVILREEKYLESKFGEEYLSYKKQVRRWL
jgi:protein-S-isoprenylcysteine O-methyltransferase Ste14